jgi:hypothetical protein
MRGQSLTALRRLTPARNEKDRAEEFLGITGGKRTRFRWTVEYMNVRPKFEIALNRRTAG